MKTFTFLLVAFAFCYCGDSETDPGNIELFTDASKQDSVFNNLMVLTNNSIASVHQNDSLAFLILPVQASCPSCRKKTIDSIVKYQNNLRANHFIVISATGGRKLINSFFREEKSQLPVSKDYLFLDTTNIALKFNLYDEEPTIYYTYNRKPFKKVVAIPRTVRKDLRDFFSGFTNENSLTRRK